MYYVKVWKLNDRWIMLFFGYSVDALNIRRIFLSVKKQE